ncbi:hypothetical protein H0H92_010236 [Tricholoma furcatifolium]|nr:hypothetical protein H0H92_010236 [Tricholoma furcatifolium]
MHVFSEDILRRIIKATLSPDSSHEGISYATTTSLAATSLGLYHEVMPLLLHTITLPSHKQLLAFNRCIAYLQLHHDTGSRLALPNHSTLVRRFFVTSEDANFPDRSSGDWVEYKKLDVVLKNAECLGFSNFSLHLLDSALERHDFDVDPSMESWRCRRAVLFGNWWRWNSLKQSLGGAMYLAQLTHLTMCLEDNAGSSLMGMPSWLKAVPFEMMPRLTHFACPLVQETEEDAMDIDTPTTTMRVLVAPRSAMIQRWMLDPGCHEDHRPHISTKAIVLTSLYGGAETRQLTVVDEVDIW